MSVVQTTTVSAAIISVVGHILLCLQKESGCAAPVHDNTAGVACVNTLERHLESDGHRYTLLLALVISITLICVTYLILRLWVPARAPVPNRETPKQQHDAALPASPGTEVSSASGDRAHRIAALRSQDLSCYVPRKR